MKYLIVLSSLAVAVYGASEVTPIRGIPWPLPRVYQTLPTYFTLDPSTFTFSGDISKCEVISAAVKRYKNLMFPNSCTSQRNRYPFRKLFSNESVEQLTDFKLLISNPCEEYPYMNMDEQYLLKVNTSDYPNAAFLYGKTVWGILRGLESLSQMVYPLSNGMFAINTSLVVDFPRYSYRGMLMDTSRHFIPLSVIYQNLDAMAQVKMNVFHWHIVDDQSFPFVSQTFPKLSENGAFKADTHVYSPKDVASVIKYARLRGIRVLAEFDTPGHTLSWGKGQSGLLTPCYNKQTTNDQFGPIDPISHNTYKFLKLLFSEISRVFPDKYIHLGGDEVNFDCWKSNPIINDFMKIMKFDDNYSLLEDYYMQNLVDIVKGLKKQYIVWQEVFDNGVKLQPDTVIHVWKNEYQSELSNVTAAGFQAILSSCWYLNRISFGDDWKKFYACEPSNFTGSESQHRLVQGGEACMWGEYVDGSNYMTRTWPRAAAVAEKLWSSVNVTSADKAAPRIEALRCNMYQRGLKVEPVNGPGYCECDYF